MSYSSVLAQLFAIGHTRSSHLSLQVAQALDEALRLPSRRFRAIHVAGSNGKGSVCFKMAKALEFAGLHVGLYTSPHLFTFRERIALSSHLIEEAEVVEGLETLLEIDQRLQLNANFFELTTALAFHTFAKHEIDIAVIETGLGGRLDATNILSPELCVITSISREHAALLGRDLETIAYEKAGIIKPQVPVVIGPNARYQAIHQRAHELQAPLIASRYIGTFFDEENSAVAKLALEQLNISSDAIEKGIALRPACRFERSGYVIFDVAHNPDGIFHLLQALHDFYPERKWRFVVGFSRDKDFGECLPMIARVASHVHLVQANSPRAASPQTMAKVLGHIASDKLSCHASVREGVLKANTAAREHGEMLVVTGSFYLMAEAKAALGDHPPSDDSGGTSARNEMILEAGLLSSASST